MYKKIDLSDAVLCNVSEDVAKEYIDFRILKKKELTQRAFKRAMTAAMQCEQHGIPADEAIELTIDAGWQGVVVEYVVNEKRRRQEAAGETGRPNSNRGSTRSDRADADLWQYLNGQTGESLDDSFSQEIGQFNGRQH